MLTKLALLLLSVTSLCAQVRYANPNFDTNSRVLFPTNLQIYVAPSNATTSLKIQDWLTNIVDVRAYGVNGGDALDDTTNINLARIAAVGKTLYFPPGTYLITNQITFVGSGVIQGDNATIKWNGSGNDITMFQVTGTNITLRGLAFNGNSATCRGITIAAGSDNVRIEDCRIYDIVQITGDTLHSGGIVIHGGSKNLFIERNKIDNVNAAIGGLASGVFATDAVNTNVTTNIVIRANTISRTGPVADGDGIKIQFSNGDCYADISDNYLVDNAKRGIKIQAPKVTVSNNRIETYNTNSSVYSAISVYASKVDVIGNKIGGTGVFGYAIDLGSTVTNSSLLISGNEIKNGSGADVSFADGIEIAGTIYDLRIVNNTIEHVRHGIRGLVELKNSSIIGNVITNATQTGITLQENSRTNYLYNVAIIGNAITGQTTYGIRVAGGTNLVVNGNVGVAAAGWNFISIDSTVVNPVKWGNSSTGEDSIGLLQWDRTLNQMSIGQSTANSTLDVFDTFRVSASNTNYYFEVDVNASVGDSINIRGPFGNTFLEYNATGLATIIGSGSGSVSAASDFNAPNATVATNLIVSSATASRIAVLGSSKQVTSGSITEANILTESEASAAYSPLGHTHAASDVVSGTMATARLGSGTADSTTYLRGDSTWQTISASGGALVTNGIGITVSSNSGSYTISHNVEAGANITLSTNGVALVITSTGGAGSGDDVYVNHANVTHPNLTNSPTAIWEVSNTNVFVYPTNIANAQIASGAAIDATKIADGSVTSTEFQYIGGLTSDAQTQINGKQAAFTTGIGVTNISNVLHGVLEAGSNITLGTNGNAITIASSASGGGETNTASNLGSGYGVWYDKNGVDLRFNSISNGIGVAVSSNANLITIRHNIEAGSNVTLTTNGSALVITASASGGSGDDVYVNGSDIVNPDFDDSGTFIWSVANTNVTGYPTNLANAQIASGAAIATSKLALSSALTESGTNISVLGNYTGHNGTFTNSLTVGSTNIAGEIAGKQTAFTTGVGVTNVANVLSANITNGSNITLATNANGVLEIAATSGGSYKVVLPIFVQSAKLTNSNPAVIDASGNHFKLLFDATTDEFASWSFSSPDRDATDILVVVNFTMASATTGAVVITAQIMADGGTSDWDTDHYDTAVSATVNVPAAAGYWGQAQITMTSDGALGSYSPFKLLISRDADNGSDTATGDMEVISGSVVFTR